VISVCGEHHRWEEDDQSMAAKNGNQSKPTQHDSNSVRVEVQVASTDGSHEQSLPYQSDIAHYPPGGIHPLRMNLLGPTRPVSPHMIGLASSEARESSDAQ
jgi:hypothetical protein